jgi:hypothetical protein
MDRELLGLESWRGWTGNRWVGIAGVAAYAGLGLMITVTAIGVILDVHSSPVRKCLNNGHTSQSRHSRQIAFLASSNINRLSHTKRGKGPARRSILCHRKGAGRGCIDSLVHPAQEVDRVEILVAAVKVRHPFARFA